MVEHEKRNICNYIIQWNKIDRIPYYTTGLERA
jgi:hypothetical protein